MSEQTHDRLQAECFQWLWNTHPHTRYCCFAVINEMKLLSFVPKGLRARIVSTLKAIGLLPGVFDMLMYWKGKMICFDIKVGKDKLSPAQEKFKSMVLLNGGYCFEIRDFDTFKDVIAMLIV